ncbi:VOC family protein [bacterium]|nr:VOC family protein [bacterium]
MINAIQHIGFGVNDRDRSWSFYRKLGFDVPMSLNQSRASRMEPLVGGDYERKVVIAANLLGGATLEIFQYLSTEPKPYPVDWNWGNPGMSATALKVRDLNKALDLFGDMPESIVSRPTDWPANPSWKAALVKDPDNLLIYLVEIPGMPYSLKLNGNFIGGIVFSTVAVSDMERSLEFYRNVLDYKDIVYDWQGYDPMLSSIPGGNRRMRRVMLKDSRPSTSFYSFYLDRGMIELVEVEGDKGKHIYNARRWGDVGQMEICFDVHDIKATFDELKKRGAEPLLEPNTEDFDMGHGSTAFFAYFKDPDGTMIELAEATKLKITNSIGIDLKKRKPGKALPKWLMKMSRHKRYKD